MRIGTRTRGTSGRLAACLAAAWVTIAAAPQGGLGQSPSVGSERATVTFRAGAFIPVTTFDDAMFGESSLLTGAGIAVSGTAWVTERVGVRASVVRSSNAGHNEENPFAPLAVQNATQWILAAEVLARQPMNVGVFSGFPYVGLGMGAKQYTWSLALHDEERYFALTAAGGVEVRHPSLGPVGFTLEARAFRSAFNSFGINGGNWRVGTRANQLEPIGFYGGVTDDVTNWDVLLTGGVSVSF